MDHKTGDWWERVKRPGAETQKIPIPAAGDALQLKNGPQILVREGSGTLTNATLTGNFVTGSLGTYTAGFGKIGTGDSVNFKMEYVPFNLTVERTNPWTAFNSNLVFDLGGNKEPVWIIRNGVNDESQDNKKNFTVPWSGPANGNGVVCFGIAA
jgi:hypothetical protein